MVGVVAAAAVPVDVADVQARTFLFGAKAAPGYGMAKRIIHLINAVGEVVSADERVKGKLKVLYPANYNVTLAERIIPAASAAAVSCARRRGLA